MRATDNDAWAGPDPWPGGTPGQGGPSSRRLLFHSFRHSFTTMLANLGVPQELRQKLTGHRSAEINARYSRHELEVIREAVSRLSIAGSQ